MSGLLFSGLQGNPGDQSQIKGRFFDEQETLVPTSIGAAQGELVNVTGTEVIDAGRLVIFQLQGGRASSLATATDLLVYVAIKGATTGMYYGIAFLTQSAGAAFILARPDKINIVTRNQDTVPHVMSGYWQATSPQSAPGQGQQTNAQGAAPTGSGSLGGSGGIGGTKTV